MSSHNSVTSSRLRQLVLIAVIFVLLVAFASACAATDEAIRTGVEQTMSARDEVTRTFNAAVASAVAATADQARAEQPPATATPINVDELGSGGGSIDACGAECDERIQQEVEDRTSEISTKAVKEYLAQDQEALDTEIDKELDAAAGGGSVPCGGGPCATVIVDSNINVRNGPGTEYEIIDFLPSGASVPVFARSPLFDNTQLGWLNISLSENLDRRGWVKAEFMSVTPPLQQVKIVETIPPTPKIWPTVTRTPTPTATPTSTPTPTPTSTPVPGVTVNVINASSSVICTLRVYPTVDQTGPNRLANPLLTGSQVAITLVGQSVVYNFRAWDCSDNLVDEQLGQIVSDGYTWVISDP